MIKRLKKHTFYEVWNEWTAESVYFNCEPTLEDIKELCIAENWFPCKASGIKDITEFISKYVNVFLEPRVWTREDVLSCETDKNGKIVGYQG